MFLTMNDQKIIIWVVDDRIENQVMIERSFRQVRGHCRIVQIHSCAAYYEKVERCENAGRPHIIFMDFFMGEAYGTDLVKYLAARRHLIGFPLVIGHSSNLQASGEIVQAGGDFVLEKIKGLPVSEAIVEHFATIEQIRDLINRRSLPAGKAMPERGGQ